MSIELAPGVKAGERLSIVSVLAKALAKAQHEIIFYQLVRIRIPQYSPDLLAARRVKLCRTVIDIGMDFPSKVVY